MDGEVTRPTPLRKAQLPLLGFAREVTVISLRGDERLRVGGERHVVDWLQG